MQIKKIKNVWHFKTKSSHIKSFNAYGPTKTACLVGAIASLKLDMDELSEKMIKLKEEKLELNKKIESLFLDSRKG